MPGREIHLYYIGENGGIEWLGMFEQEHMGESISI